MSIRDKNPKNNRGPADYFSPKNSQDPGKDLVAWLNANPGGGKTDFTYRRPNALVPAPEAEDAIGDNELVKLTAILGVTSASVLLAKVGVLGSGAGLAAKLLYDVWNGVASTLLPGAILKY